MDPKEKKERSRLKKLQQIKKEIGLNKMTSTQRKSLRQLKKIYPVNPGSQFATKKNADIKSKVNKAMSKATSSSFKDRQPGKAILKATPSSFKDRQPGKAMSKVTPSSFKERTSPGKAMSKVTPSSFKERTSPGKAMSKVTPSSFKDRQPRKAMSKVTPSSFKERTSPGKDMPKAKVTKKVPIVKKKKPIVKTVAKTVAKTKRPISVTIAGGDSLSKIASKYGTTVKELMNSNKKITNPNVIKEGDSLNLGKLTPKRKSVYDNLNMKPKVKNKVVPSSVASKPVTNTRKDNREEFGKAIQNMPTRVRKNKSSSLPSSSNNPIFKEIIKSKGGEPAFRDKKNLSSMIGRAIGSKATPEESMNTAVYNELADEYNNDSGQMSEAKKDLYLKMKNSKSGGKVGKKKGGMVKRSYGGKVKRNMGGMVSPRKKVVFRRGGGRALRGMGKAIYSNKMY